MPKTPTPPPAYEPPECPEHIHMALKALQTGNASEIQQKNALDWIIKSAALTYDVSYRPGVDGDRETAFAEGRRFVGTRILRELNTIRARKP